MSTPVSIFTNQGDTTGIQASLVGLDAYRHQPLALYISGTWGGATATVTISPDGVNWFSFSGNTLTANGVMAIPFTCMAIQIAITGGTSPSLNAVAI